VNEEDAERLANSILGHLYRDPESKCLAESAKRQWADEGCNTASIPIIISDGQRTRLSENMPNSVTRLSENMPNSVSELNYETLPITGDSWFKYHARTNIIALGGQVRESVNNELIRCEWMIAASGRCA
jgi:hypothetical protein